MNNRRHTNQYHIPGDAATWGVTGVNFVVANSLMNIAMLGNSWGDWVLALNWCVGAFSFPHQHQHFHQLVAVCCSVLGTLFITSLRTRRRCSPAAEKNIYIPENFTFDSWRWSVPVQSSNLLYNPPARISQSGQMISFTHSLDKMEPYTIHRNLRRAHRP